MYGSSCAIMGNTSCNKCLHSPTSFAFIMTLVCVVGHFDFIALEQKRFITKVLLGCDFVRYVVMALGVGLICLVGVEDILIVFSLTCVGSITVEELRSQTSIMQRKLKKVTSPLNATHLPCEQNLSLLVYTNNQCENNQ